MKKKIFKTTLKFQRKNYYNSLEIYQMAIDWFLTYMPLKNIVINKLQKNGGEKCTEKFHSNRIKEKSDCVCLLRTNA